MTMRAGHCAWLKCSQSAFGWASPGTIRARLFSSSYSVGIRFLRIARKLHPPLPAIQPHIESLLLTPYKISEARHGPSNTLAEVTGLGVARKDEPKAGPRK